MGATSAITIMLIAVLTACERDFDHAAVVRSGTTCVTCHEGDYKGAKDPVHVNNFPTTCESCHSTTRWRPAYADGDGHPVDRFPLSGGHANLDCATCHTVGFGPGDTPSTCISCHQDDRAIADDNVSGHPGFVHACQNCHTIDGWKPAADGHPRERFPLRGKHAEAACTDCHTKGFGRGDTPSECVACHLMDRMQADSTVDGHDKVEDNCTSCHNDLNWTPALITPHPQNRFPLNGTHGFIECTDCHTKGFGPGDTPNECVACHVEERVRADASIIGHSEFSTECVSCHSDLEWIPARGHPEDRFPLTGGHMGVQCASCHTNGYAPGSTPSQCIACHTDDRATADATVEGHTMVGTDCASCHDGFQWRPALITPHPQDRFPLLGTHAVIRCADCHTKGFGPGDTPNDCASCHKLDRAEADVSVDGHPTFPQACTSCHDSLSWTPARSHPQDRFPLDGGHRAVECVTCHSNGYDPGDTPNTCISCHADDKARGDANVGGHNAFGSNCTTCHNITAWSPASDGHPRDRFPLRAAHDLAACTDCHTVGFGPGDTPVACWSCHMNDKAQADGVVAGHTGFGTQCEGCHSDLAWKPAMTVAHPQDRFPLNGTHAFIDCVDCHTEGFGPGDTPNECIACHSDDRALADARATAHFDFSNTCTNCHSDLSWIPAQGHPATRFPLTGGHSNVACATCHTNGYEMGATQSACVSCHADDKATANVRVGGHTGFPDDCTSCHSIAGWRPASDGHPRDRFPLDGGHTNVACASCHTTGYGPGDTSSDCISCHADDRATANVAVAGHTNFGTDCASCHGNAMWKPAANLAHPTDRFPLNGTHATIDCVACHTTGFGPGDTPNQCGACHAVDRARADGLVAGHTGFSNDCASCHSDLSWRPAQNGTHPEDRFPLQGGHSNVACATCHTVGYGPGDTPNDCASCHGDDRARGNANVGGHAAFPSDCTTCHTINAWSPASDGHPRDRFPLRARHDMIACTDCHKVGFAAGQTPNECIACHAADKATADSIVAGHTGFGSDCAACHSDLAWKPADGLAHPTDRFPLNGTHAVIDCVDCHTTGFGPGDTPNQCSACHAADRSVANANVSGHTTFPSDCTLCHTDLAWRPQVGHPNERFPLAGAHATTLCGNCHTNGYGPGATSPACVSCHADDRTRANNNISGHSAFGTDCAGCHDSGIAWTPAAAGLHPQDRFPLRNRHAQIQCTQCHTTGFGPGDTPNQCVSCHASDRTRANNSVSGHSGFGTDCKGCHTDAGWTPAAGHPENRFPITSGKHSGVSCTGCHNPNLGSSIGGQNTDCIGCHTGEHTRTRMANTHNGVRGYSDDGTQNFCLDCHPSGRN